VSRVVEAATAWTGTLHGVVHCAGGSETIGLVTQIDSEAWRRTVDLNINGTMYVLKHAAREMVRERVVRDGGPVMNVNERGRPTLEQQQDSSDSVVNWRREQRDRARQRLQQGERPDFTEQRMEQRAERNRFRAPVGARPDRPAPAPETAYNRNRHSEWRTDWRRDHRYDWRNYRDHHRSIFRVGIYYDPFGWGYQRYGIGWRLWPSYYSSSYWLSDPYMYRLPYAPWPYKWVRYYDDALLVDTYTGQVVDVMYDFFW